MVDLTTDDRDILDNPAWAALAGPQARFGESKGRAARYQPDVTPLAAVSDWTDDQAWQDLSALAGSGTVVVLAGVHLEMPPGWETLGGGDGVQMIGTSRPQGEDSTDIVTLTAADVPEMIRLVARTEPGPFLPRTIELGPYLGIRREGALVSMAGVRLRAPGWTEISAVCTDEAFRGQGLAGRLVRATVSGILGRGDRPFMHASAANTPAIRLYEHLGFEVRTHTSFAVVRVP